MAGGTRTRLCPVALVLTGICAAVLLPQTTEAGVIFSDTYGPDWKGHWSVSVIRDPVYGGEGLALSKTRGMRFDVSSDGGMVIADEPVLQMRINFLVEQNHPGHSLTNVRVLTLDGTLFEFDDRSEGWTCSIDGTSYTDAQEVFFDTDPDTWQLFEIDLSQTDYFGWPYQSRQIGDDPIIRISLDTWGNTTGDALMVVDNAKLIPEPATICLFSIGAALLLSCRRKNATRHTSQNTNGENWW